MIKFGDFAPDLPTLIDQGAVAYSPLASNVIPSAMGYLPLPGPAEVSSSALTGSARGCFGAKTSDNAVFIAVGSDTKLYQLNGASFDDVTRLSGGDYTLTTEDKWRFTQFRNKLIATQISDDIQYFDLDSATNFGILATSTLKPKAKYVATIGEFPVFAHMDEGGTRYPNRVRWPSINNEQDFDESVVNQSDHQDLPDGGQITGITGNQNYGTVFTDGTLYRMDYVGGQVIYDFQKVQAAKGSQVPGSIVGYDQGVFYYSPGGFMHYNGVSSEPIGSERLDRYFLADFDFNSFANVEATVDPVNKIYAIAYPGVGNNGGMPNNWLIYRWDLGKWSCVLGQEIANLFQGFTQGYSLEDLDSISTSLDALPASLDSQVYKGGLYLLGGIDSSNYAVFFDGEALDATVDTGDMNLTPGQLSSITSIRPIVEGGSPTMKLLTRNSQGNTSYTTSSSYSPESTGEVVMEDADAARYHRFRVEVSGGFTQITGIEDIEVIPQGNQ